MRETRDLVELWRAQVEQRDEPERMWMELAVKVADIQGVLDALTAAQDYADAQRAWQSNQIQLWEYVTQRRDALLAAFPGVQGEQQ